MRLEERPPPTRTEERRSRTRSRDRIRRHEATIETIETRKEYSKKETTVEITVNANSEIRSTRIDDILKSVSASSAFASSTLVSTSQTPPRAVTEPEEAPPPPPPARTDTRDIKDILATHRSRPRRPFNDNPEDNGVTSPEPTPPPSKPTSPPPSKPRSKSAAAPPKPPSSSSTDAAEPASSSRSRTKSARSSKKRSEKVVKDDNLDEDKSKKNSVDKGEQRDGKQKSKKKDKEENGIPTVAAEVAPVEKSEMKTEEDKLFDRLRKRKEKRMDAKPDDVDSSVRPKTPMSPPDELEKQALDSLEGLTSDIIKERDDARRDRNEAREKCASILNDYDGRRQAWQNQLNVVKIRLEHYSRRHDKLRNDIVKQQEQFDVERSRMKERHANQIEGLFGDLFNKIKTDDQYVGSSAGLDEVNYKLQAFMELWKGLAHDVDDLYDKEHYCLRLCETVKSLQDQIKHQNNVIATLLKGHPISSDAKESPPSSINVTIESHKWDKAAPNVYRPYHKDSRLPDFDEITTLDNLLPDDDGFDDILAQFAPIEETFKTMDLSLARPKRLVVSRDPPPKNFDISTSPPPRKSDSSPPRKRETRPRTPKKSEPTSSHPPRRSEPATEPPPRKSEPATSPPPRRFEKSPSPERVEIATSPLADNSPLISVEVRDVPCRQSAPPLLPKPTININRTISDHNKQPELPIKVDPEDIRKRYNLPPKPPKVDLDSAPVVQSKAPFSGPSMFDDTPAYDPPAVEPIEPSSHEPEEPALQPARQELPKETQIDDPKPKRKRKKKKPAKTEPIEIPVEATLPVEEDPGPDCDVEEATPVQRATPRQASPSPTPSFRRRRASMESAKDFSVLGDPDYDDYPISPPLSRHPPPLDITTRDPSPPGTLPKETTLDDPACASPAPPTDKKKKKWTPSMPIFNKKLPKTGKPAPAPIRDEPEPAQHEEPVQHEEPSTSTSESIPEQKEAAPPARPPKRAKSLPRFRDPSLPRNMASASMKRATSNPRLKKGPGSECDSEEDDSDSDIRSLIESVYMPLHLTPSRAGSKKNVNDDAKSTTSSFARRNKMPGSMGWLDSNKPNTSDEEDSSDDYTSSDDDDQSSDEESPVAIDGAEKIVVAPARKPSSKRWNNSFYKHQIGLHLVADVAGVSATSESDDDYEIPPMADSSAQDLIPNPEEHDGSSKRNSMLSSIMKDFDDNSKNWLNNSVTSNHNGEMLI